VWNEWNNLSLTNVIFAIVVIGVMGVLLDLFAQLQNWCSMPNKTFRRIQRTGAQAFRQIEALVYPEYRARCLTRSIMSRSTRQFVCIIGHSGAANHHGFQRAGRAGNRASGGRNVHGPDVKCRPQSGTRRGVPEPCA
jgi:hypothetical protein